MNHPNESLKNIKRNKKKHTTNVTRRKRVNVNGMSKKKSVSIDFIKLRYDHQNKSIQMRIELFIRSASVIAFNRLHSPSEITLDSKKGKTPFAYCEIINTWNY